MERDIFKEFLIKKGLKFTKERESILAEVLSLDGHFDSSELMINIEG